MALIDFNLSNARRFYSSVGNPLGLKGLTGAERGSNKLNLCQILKLKGPSHAMRLHSPFQNGYLVFICLNQEL